MKAIIGALAAVLTVAGCASHPPPRSFVPLVGLEPLHCETMVPLQEATPVILGEPETDKNEIVFDGVSRCVRQSDGTAANYHVFRLPPADQPYLITVRTEPVGPAYLVVSAQILAADGSLIRTLGAEDFSFHGTSLTALVRSRPGQDYLVVRSDGTRVGQSFDQIAETSLLYSTTSTTTTSSGGKTHVFVSNATAPVGGSTTGNYVFSHNGSLHVTAKPIVGG